MSIALKELETDTILMNSGAFANLLRMRDRFVGIHSERIRSLTRNVCERLDLSWTEGLLIETAAQLHDLGTIAIPDPVLHKNGILTPEERLIMQGHAQFGYEALEKRPSSLQWPRSCATTMSGSTARAIRTVWLATTSLWARE
jgi:response regulator RpfG family c-di-GMP phosphodiesterase